MFGGDRDPQVVADERFWFEYEMRASIRWQPDVDALRAGPVHIVVGIGEESACSTLRPYGARPRRGSERGTHALPG